MANGVIVQLFEVAEVRLDSKHLVPEHKEVHATEAAARADVQLRLAAALADLVATAHFDDALVAEAEAFVAVLDRLDAGAWDVAWLGVEYTIVEGAEEGGW